MEYFLFCLDWWNKGGFVNYIILSSSFFVGLFFFSRRYTKNFTNIMIGVVPLLGLLGTVVGMIDTFNALQNTGADVQSLSAGISKAMITTASGLCVAIFGTCILPFKSKKPEYDIEEIEKLSIEQLEQITNQQNSILIYLEKLKVKFRFSSNNSVAKRLRTTYNYINDIIAKLEREWRRQTVDRSFTSKQKDDPSITPEASGNRIADVAS